MLTGCVAPPGTGASDAPADPPAYGTIASAYNDRIGGLRRTYAYGVLELRWEDDRGVHSEPQVDVELWLDLPWRTALRVEKLGENLFWLGSDESTYWVFDLLEESNRRAVLRDRHDHESVESAAHFGLRPDSLLDLLALRPLPTVAPDDLVIRYDGDRKAWALEGLGMAGGPRIFVDVATLRPVGVELTDPHGEVLVESSLSHYASVATPGVSVLAYPKQAMWIDIVDIAGGGLARLHLNEMTADVADQPMDRVFDLDRLMRSLEPDFVEGAPGRAIAGSGQ